jgi:hypothetical protein
MTDHSRRNFLKTASIGAAAAGVAVAVPFGSDAASAETVSNAPTHDGPVVAWVSNPANGEVTVMAGEHELVHHDTNLARQLSQLAARATK